MLLTPIARALTSLSKDEREKLKRKFDIAYLVATETLSFKKYASICALEKNMEWIWMLSSDSDWLQDWDRWMCDFDSDVTLNYNTVSYIISYYYSFMSQSFKLC